MARGRLVSTRAHQGPCRASNLVVPGSRGSWMVSGPPYSWSNHAARNPGGGGSGAAYPMTNVGILSSFPAAFRLIFFTTEFLAGQRIFDIGRCGRDASAEKGMACQDRLLHEPGNFTIGEMAFDSRPEPGDVLRLRVVHFEQTAGAEAERGKISRGLRMGKRQAFHEFPHHVHRLPVLLRDAGVLQERRRLVAVDRCELLSNLLAAAVPMQIPPSAQVHQDVEDEAVPAVELLQQLVVRAASSHADLDQFLFFF